MHREIQIKQFPIVIHIDGLRHETSGLCEKTNSIYIVFYLLYTTMSKWSECAHTSGVDVCAARSGSRCIHTGRRRQRLTEGVSEAWCWRNFQAPTEASANQIASWKYPIPFMQHQRSMWLVVVTMTAHQHHASDTPSVKRWRRWARARAHTHVTHTRHTHTRHTPDVCAHSDHLDMVVYKR